MRTWLVMTMLLGGTGTLRTEGTRGMSDAAKSVTVRGTAQNAKAGAVIGGADPDPIYIAGLDRWPDAMTGKSVTATGVLSLEEYIPRAKVSPEGLHGAGGDGEQSVLRDARWGLARENWKAMDQVVTVTGEARNIGKSAAIVTPEGPCYMTRLGRWPAEVVGKKVSGTGRVLRNKALSNPEHEAAGGEPGENWALDDPRWSQP